MEIGWPFARPLTVAAMIDIFVVVVVGCGPGCGLWLVWCVWDKIDKIGTIKDRDFRFQ